MSDAVSGNDDPDGGDSPRGGRSTRGDGGDGGDGGDRENPSRGVGRGAAPVDTAGALAAVGAAFGAMWAVSAGLLPPPGFDEPVWYLLVALVVGYWVAFVRWVRTG